MEEVEKKTEAVDPKTLYTKEKPHVSGAYWDGEVGDAGKWVGYKPTKGVTPPWNPFDPSKRKPRTRLTISEKKFLYALSQTGNITAAFRAAYKVKPYPNKHLESARCRSIGARVLARIRKKAPDLVAAFTFDDVTPDFIKREMYNLYHSDHASIAEKTRLLELMGKTQALFTDKIQTDAKIREIAEPVYKDYAEREDDFPDLVDQRLTRFEIDKDKQNLA